MRKNNFQLIFILGVTLLTTYFITPKTHGQESEPLNLLADKNSTVCKGLGKQPQVSSEVSAQKIFKAHNIDFHDGGRLLTFAQVPKSGKGKVVQSAAIEKTTCSLIGFSSIKDKQKKERLILWRFDKKGDANGSLLTTQFGHGQDLTRQLDKSGEEWFWVSDETGTSARRFQITSNEDELKIRNLQKIILQKHPLKSHNVAITQDNRHLIMLGRNSNFDQGQFMIFVYDLNEIEAQIQPGAIDVNLVDITPKYKWPLTDLQQYTEQWRQGIAGLGNSIFILSGNATPKDTKILATYSLSGETHFIQEVRVGRKIALLEGKHYEPEGLEIFNIDDRPHLGIGIASGKLGKRKYRIWVTPLEASN